MTEGVATVPSHETSSKWQAIISLGILHAVFVFSILAYEQNQGKILERHGLDHFTHTLEQWALFISCLIPPLAGWLSDRYGITRGKRFLVINAAVIGTALLFMVVAFTYASAPGFGPAKGLPFMMLLWVTGMHFFHSPTHSFVREYAPKAEWPLANAVILLIAGFISAGQVFIANLLDKAGTTATFVTGGILLSLSAWWFVRSSQEKVHAHTRAEFKTGQWWYPLLYGAFIGLVGTLFSLLLKDMNYGGFRLGENNEYFVPLTLAVLAVIGIPLGQYAQKVGTDKLFNYAIPAFAALAALGFASAPGLLVLPLLMVAFSAVKICAMPKALKHATNGNAGFITGMYWMGFYIVPVVTMHWLG